MIKKILLSVIAATSLISSPIVAYANISENIIQTEINDLTESEQKLFKILLDYSIYNKLHDTDADNYFSALSLNLGDLSLDNLLSMRTYLQTLNTDESGAEYAPTIAANYSAWLTQFGIEDIDSEPSFSDKDENNTARMYFDDIAITYDYSTLKANNSSLLFLPQSASDDEIDTRILHALAFFAALEYGKPIDFTDSEANSLMDTTWKIYSKLQSCIGEKEDELLSGEFLDFYSSAEHLYYLMSNEDIGIWIAAY